MAYVAGKSGAFTFNNEHFTFRVAWSETYEVSSNTSIVSIDSLQLQSTTYGGTWNPHFLIKVNNETVATFNYFSPATHSVSLGSVNTYSTVVAKDGGVSAPWRSSAITHNSDGTKGISITVVPNAPLSVIQIYRQNGAITKQFNNVSQSIQLTTIPRASSITSAGNVTLGNKCSVQWTPASAAFKYKLQFSLGKWSYTTDFISPNTTSAYTYTGYVIPRTLELLDDIPNSTTAAMKVVLTTYNSGGSQVGSISSKTFTVTVPADIVPTVGTITLDPTDINGHNLLVKGKNSLKISVSGCSGGTGSGIKSYTFSGPSISTTTTNSYVTISSVSTIGALTYKVTVTDNRGRTNSKTATISCWDYYAPYFTAFNAYRANADGSADLNGTYLKCTYSTKYASVNSTNTIAVTAYYNNKSVTASGGSVLINLNGDTGTTYKVYLKITDSYGGSGVSSTLSIFGQTRIFNITSDGTGVAIGKMASKSETFECRWEANFNDKVTFGNGVQGRIYTWQGADGANQILLETGENTSGGAPAGLNIAKNTVFIPNSANSGLVNLGQSGRLWNQLYAANGTINTSDRKQKTDIEPMSDNQEKLFNELKPVTYKFKNGTSNRTHYGFISQDVEEAINNVGMQSTDFAGFCKDLQIDDDGKTVLDENGDKAYDYSLRYAEFIALNTYMIQKLQAEIVELKAIIAELKSNDQN